MAKTLVFDTGPVISFTTTNILWAIEPLKEMFRGRFIITSAVKHELVDAPILTKKFKFEAFQVRKLLADRAFEVYSSPSVVSRANSMMELANTVFSIGGKNMSIVQVGEMETLAAALEIGADAVVIDERITRALIEQPHELARRLARKLHARVSVDDRALHDFTSHVKNLKVIRSIELVVVAYKAGLFDEYLSDKSKETRQDLLDSLLWGVKLHGCSVTEEEIVQIVKSEG